MITICRKITLIHLPAKEVMSFPSVHILQRHLIIPNTQRYQILSTLEVTTEPSIFMSVSIVPKSIFMPIIAPYPHGILKYTGQAFHPHFTDKEIEERRSLTC